MTKFRKKPIILDAAQWHEYGDHPRVRLLGINDNKRARPCPDCGRGLMIHGVIYTLEGDAIVCPGDFIVTGTEGEAYPVKERIFGDIYEAV
jgi:hypothetical protein